MPFLTEFQNNRFYITAFVPLLLIFISDVAQGYYYSTIERCNLDLKNMSFPRNQKELRVFCGEFKRYYKCVKDLQIPTDELDDWSLILEKSKILVLETCDNRTSRHEGYLRSFPCIFEVMRDSSYREFCKRFTVIALQKFKKYSSLSVAFQTISYDVGWLCIIKSVSVDCLAHFVLHKCGVQDHKVFKDIAENSYFYLLGCQGTWEYLNAKTMISILREPKDLDAFAIVDYSF
ncbi:hypothetical protein CEXT_736032 [Caerostris extrusa]|uniref:Uncharacterized protein n=1 Tax=Caerostris extrusa TaxID=172846 RepID=A0AAV4TIN4_CAEEX|nr:hypothetical protein CEXT_736032 [Caerostris extrusa]